jgi:hypothetical protein
MIFLPDVYLVFSIGSSRHLVAVDTPDTALVGYFLITIPFPGISEKSPSSIYFSSANRAMFVPARYPIYSTKGKQNGGPFSFYRAVNFFFHVTRHIAFFIYLDR